MNDPFLAHLVQRGLPEHDAIAVGKIYRNFQETRSQVDIVSNEAGSSSLHILMTGWACKYRRMSDGRRQIMQVHLPGEICDLGRVCTTNPPFAVFALTDCRVATVPLEWMRKLADEHPALRELLLSLIVGESATLTEHVVSLGRRSARERTAFLLHDLLHRLHGLGEARDDTFRLPMTQVDMGDHLGLSTVHINRTLQDLRSEQLIENSGRTYRIIDAEALARVADGGPRSARGTPMRHCA